MNSLRGGMQVHAVPESERALDASGRRLPWGYEYADTEIGRRREPEEKGPFGRSTRRRGFSRSKTATPARKEDIVRIENTQNEDVIFGKYLQDQKAREPAQQQKTNAPLSSIDVNAGTGQQSLPDKEPTEVILYGFGRDLEWAAIEYYERVSEGVIYEDYDRHPPQQRYDQSLSYGRARMQRSLSKAALAKRNAYKGGDHWIKVTFDSPEAADLACHVSPHQIHGFLVYAELYQGKGPPSDAPIPYSNAGAQIDGPSLPKSFSTNTLSQDTLMGSPESSNTFSSVTATGVQPSQSALPRSATTSNLNPNTNNPFEMSRRGGSTALQERTPAQQRPLRVPGATRAVLLPAEQAFLPATPTYSNWLTPILGSVFGGKGDLIGSQVPRTEDGGFDWKTASFYWCFFAWLDAIFGTDMCGLKGDD